MSTEIGREAEKAAGSYLESLGFKVVEYNWRTRRAEIDIVASETVKTGILKSQKIIHFIEVKYRKTNLHGDGLDYITPRKQKQMQFAAGEWVHENNWSGDYQIDAIAVTGNAKGWSFDYRSNVIN